MGANGPDDAEYRYVRNLDTLAARQIQLTRDLVGTFKEVDPMIHGEDARRQLQDLWNVWRSKLNEIPDTYQP